MKKYSVLLITLLISLSGCGQKVANVEHVYQYTEFNIDNVQHIDVVVIEDGKEVLPNTNIVASL
ncbi:MAG: hypothetical protein K0U38_11500 [Epsilonproteobacteria bacterium]|nr:hypothetical protein [Campylobacterota bacterium]